MFKKVLEYAGEYRKTTYASMAVMLIGIVMNVLPFLFLYQLMEPLLLHENVEVWYVVWRVLAIGVCGVLYALFYVKGLALSHRAAYKTLRNLRSSLQGYEAAALCRWHGLPLFFMEHSSYVVTEGPDSEAVRRLHAVMDAATVNACVSSVLYKVMAPYRETRIIPDFVDDSRFIIQETAPRETFTFRAMGQLRPIKGHDTLIRAFALLKKMTDRPVCLEIAGKGVLHDNLQKLIDQLGIADNCRLVGAIPRDEVVGFMNGCDCFVCSSRTEMLSCVLHECAACARPAIATRCGGPQDIITEETGVLVPVDDPQAMAQAMLEMLDRAAGYDQERIRASILERFGIEPVCGQLIKACQDSAKGGK